jgi:hypothetical protein
MDDIETLKVDPLTILQYKKISATKATATIVVNGKL